jgi:hypothetical protein
MSANATHIGITKGHLAAGQSGLSVYGAELSANQEEILKAIRQNTSNCAWSFTALAVIAVLAVVLATVLFVKSGGPASIGVFYGGVSFSGAAIFLMIGSVILTIFAMRYNRKQRGDHASLINEKISNEDALAAMQAEGVTAEQITHVLHAFGEEENGNLLRQQFIRFTYDAFFPPLEEGKTSTPLTPAQTNVLTAFAAFPADLYAQVSIPTNAQRIDRQFAVIILAHLDPAIAENEKGSKLLDHLFGAVIAPQDEDEFPIFVRHPAAFARQTYSDGGQGNYVLDIYLQMDYSQRAAFLNEAMTVYIKLYEKAEANEAGAKEKLQALTRNIFIIIDATLSPEFIELFSNPQAPAQPNAQVEPQEALLKELSRWPQWMARYVVSFMKGQKIGTIPVVNNNKGNQDANVLKKPYFMDALFRCMHQSHKQVFLDEAKKLIDFEEVGKANATDLQAYAYGSQNQNNQDENILNFPEVIELIFRASPVFMYGLRSSLKPDQVAIGLADAIIRNMSSKTALIYRAHELHGLKSSNSKQFEIDIQKEIKNQTPLAVAYFKTYPEEFKILVIDNPKLDRDYNQRVVIGLNLLEAMEDEAESAIQLMDARVVGFPNTIKFTNKLIEEAGSGNPIAESRARLMARFMYIPASEGRPNAQGRWSALKKDLKLTVNQDEPNWTRFKTKAEEQKRTVWLGYQSQS